MNKWYKFLTEEVNEEHYLSFRQLEGLFKVFHLSWKILGDSEQTGGFEFTPRVPTSPMFGEDNFTQRISLAPNINRAIFALEALKIKQQTNEKSYRKYYVYAGDLKSDPSDDIDTVKLNVEMRRCNRDLSYTDSQDFKRKYSVYVRSDKTKMAHPWDMAGYKLNLRKKMFGTYDCNDLADDYEMRKCLDLARIASPAAFDRIGLPEEKQKFYACVPDALETKEEWSLNPVTLYYIGKADIDNKRVLVNQDSLNLIKSKLRKGRIIEK